MNFIEKHSKILAVSLCLLTSGPIVSTMYAKEVQPGWHGEGADRYYILESNRQTATGLTKIDTELYYFNSKGEMQFGWQNVSDQTYYFQADGTAATGTVTIHGSEYNFQKEVFFFMDGVKMVNHSTMKKETRLQQTGLKTMAQNIILTTKEIA